MEQYIVIVRRKCSNDYIISRAISYFFFICGTSENSRNFCSEIFRNLGIPHKVFLFSENSRSPLEISGNSNQNF